VLVHPLEARRFPKLERLVIGLDGFESDPELGGLRQKLAVLELVMAADSGWLDAWVANNARAVAEVRSLVIRPSDEDAIESCTRAVALLARMGVTASINAPTGP